MGRRYDLVAMISRRKPQILWTSRKPSKRIPEKTVNSSKPENSIKPYLWMMAKVCTNTSCSEHMGV
jgi:hypothetical protein